jgi:alkaline phosphatase D
MMGRSMISRRQAYLGLLTGSLAFSRWPSAFARSVRTPDQITHRIAFGSCAFQWEAQPIWSVIAEREPDLFLFVGDAIYGDFDGKNPFTPTADTLRRDWGALAAKPEFREFRAQVPIMATWDNHDYGSHNGGAEFPLKEMTKTAFLDFFDEPPDSVRRKRNGIYTEQTFGEPGKRVQVILLDTRTFKGQPLRGLRTKEEKKAAGLSGSMGNYLPNADPEVRLLGPKQWQWLDRQLRKPADIRFIVSGTQIVADQKGMDEWGNYPRERQRLFDLIQSTGASGAIMLTGNVHFAELSRYDEGSYPIYDFTSSGLTHTSPKYAEAENSYRVGNAYAGKNFGLIEIDWSANPAPTVTFKIEGADGQTHFKHRLSLEVLMAK